MTIIIRIINNNNNNNKIIAKNFDHKINTQNYLNNKKCSNIQTGKYEESHILLERKIHKMQILKKK